MLQCVSLYVLHCISIRIDIETGNSFVLNFLSIRFAYVYFGLVRNCAHCAREHGGTAKSQHGRLVPLQQTHRGANGTLEASITQAPHEDFDHDVRTSLPQRLLLQVPLTACYVHVT